MKRKKSFVSGFSGFMAGITAFTLSASLLYPANTVAAKEQSKDETLGFPISIYDYNADNILFEYGLNSGLDMTVYHDGYSDGSGLVNSQLVNGNIEYKQSSVEKAALLMYMQFMNNDGLDGTIDGVKKGSLYDQLRDKFYVASSGISYNTNILGHSGDEFFTDYGWTALDEQTVIQGDYLLSAAPLWYQNGDGVINPGNDSVLSITTDAVSIGESTLSFYQGQGTVKVVISDGTKELASTTSNSTGWVNIDFDASDASTITISFANSGSEANRIAAPKLTSGNIDITFGQENTGSYFYDKGWSVGNGSTVNEAGFVLGEGESVLWRQSEDGVVNIDSSSTLSKNFKVTPNEPLIFNYYQNNSGQTITVSDDAGNVIASHNTESDISGWNKFIVMAGDTSSINVSLTGKGNAKNSEKISAFTISALNGSSLGNYQETKTLYADDSKKLSDAVTCMDYCYYVMNHFFQSVDGLNKECPEYNTLLLNSLGNEDNGYGFTADYENRNNNSTHIVYDINNKTLKNDGSGECRNGFFPIDGLGFNEVYTGMMAGTEANHNYHYAMAAKGSFVYEKSANLYFSFEGDDDTYLYINGQLVIDIGGAHLAQNKTVYLNELADELGLEDGKVYSLDFFYMERHTDFSDFRIATNMQVVRAEESKTSLVVQKQDSKTYETVEGAVYGLYTDAECTIPALLEDGTDALVTTNASGNAAYLNCIIPENTYYLKEVSAPEGYNIDTTTYTIIVPDISVKYMTVYDTPEKKEEVEGDDDVIPETKPTDTSTPDTTPGKTPEVEADVETGMNASGWLISLAIAGAAGTVATILTGRKKRTDETVQA